MSRTNTKAARLSPVLKPWPVLGALLMLSALVSVFWSQGLAAGGLPDFTELVEENSSAVVNISTTTDPQSSGSRFQGMPFDERQFEQLPPFLQDFFRGPQSPFGGSPHSQQPSRSMGSGFIVSATRPPAPGGWRRCSRRCPLPGWLLFHRPPASDRSRHPGPPPGLHATRSTGPTRPPQCDPPWAAGLRNTGQLRH